MWEVARNLDAYVQDTESTSSENVSNSSSEESSFKKDIEIPLAVGSLEAVIRHCTSAYIESLRCTVDLGFAQSLVGLASSLCL